MNRALWILISICITGTLIWTIRRDLHLIKLTSGDIRNRIVGARLQKDNQSPYFYKWKNGDGIRYYDPGNFNANAVSVSTASPFFHILLYPLAEFRQYTINRIWLALQYLLLAISVFLSLKLTGTVPQKIAVLTAGTGILFTEGWISMIIYGQLYLIPPFLAIAFIYYFQNNKAPAHALISGTIFIVAILIRPTILLFFLPFIFLVNKYTRHYKILFFIPSVLLLSWILTSSTQRQLWTDYRNNIQEHVKIHYLKDTTFKVNDPDPHYAEWEGMNYNEMVTEYKKGLFINHSQDVNFSTLISDIFHVKIPLPLLAGLFFIIAGIMFLVFWAAYTDGSTFYNFPLLGYSLYMLCDFFSPINRYQYYAVQWVCPLLIAGVIFTFRFRKTYALIMICLILNIVSAPLIKMEHTLGEYLWLACFFYLSLFYHKQKDVNIIRV